MEKVEIFCDLESEKSLLGCLMIDKDTILGVMDVVSYKDFYDRRNGDIYKTIVSMFKEGLAPDIVSISSKFRGRGDLDKIGGIGYLTDLVTSIPSTSHINTYANIIIDKRKVRDLVSMSQDVIEKVKEGESADYISEILESRILKISQESSNNSFSLVSDDLDNAIDRMKISYSSGIRGVKTGFSGVDRMLSGLHKSDLVILGARPSVGKTSLALDICRNIAVDGNLPVAMFSLEMSKEQITDRLISSQSGVDLWKIRNGSVSNEMEYDRINKSVGLLKSAKIFIDDNASPTISDIRGAARKLKFQNKDLSLIVVDYLQLIKPKRDSDNTVAQVTEISHGLKAIAKELDVPVLALSQLSRGVEQRQNSTPRLSDLRDSGSIEQDADVVMFIHKCYMEGIGSEQDVDLIIAKHRNGPTGEVKIRFNKETASFRD